MILLLDPTGDPLRIGLAKDGRVVADREITERREQSAKLLGCIASLLAEQDLAPAKLDAIAVVRGPGPFTSLRVAIASANALASTSNVPLVGLTADQASSLEELATVAQTSLTAGRIVQQLQPEYDRPPSITRPKESD